MGLFCAKCKTRWKTKSATAGKSMRCPKCGRALTTVVGSAPTASNTAAHKPTTVTITPVAPIVPTEFESAATSPPIWEPAPPSRPKLPARTIAALGAGLFLLLLVILVAFLATNSSVGSMGQQVALQDAHDLDSLPPGSDERHERPTPGDNHQRPGDNASPSPQDSLVPGGNNPPQGGLTTPGPSDPAGLPGHIVNDGKNPRPPILTLPGVSPDVPQTPGMVPPAPPKKPEGGLITDKKGEDPIHQYDVSFMGSKAKGQRICIIADVSGSMNSPFMFINPALRQVTYGRKSIDYLKDELLKTLSNLPGDAEFFIILFNHNFEPMPGEIWLSGKQANQVVPWIGGIKANGGTNPLPAFQYAFNMKPRPDVIFFMTDGIFGSATNAIAQLNQQKPKIVINAIQLTANPYGPLALQILKLQGQPASPKLLLQISQAQKKNVAALLEDQQQEQQMQIIANQNGGTYRKIDFSVVAAGP